MPQIRAILLDAVGTAIYPAADVSATYAEFGRRHGSRLTAKEVSPRFRRAFGRQERLDAGNCAVTSEERERDRWRSIVAEVFEDIQTEHLFEDLWQHYSWPEAWRIFPDVQPFLQVASHRRIAVILASNFDARLRGIVQGHATLGGLAGLAISSELGWKKPCHRFFEETLARFELASDEAICVGDSRTNDYDGGRKAGLTSYLLVRDGARPHEQAIGSLDELMTKLA